MHCLLPSLLFIFYSSPPWEPWEPWPPRYQRQVPLLFWQSQPRSGGELEEDTRALILSGSLLPSPPPSPPVPKIPPLPASVR